MRFRLHSARLDVHLRGLVRWLAVLFIVHVPSGGASPLDPSAATVPDVAGAWWSDVTAEIQAREYHLSLIDGGWTAPNRAQDLRARWQGGNLVVTPRVESNAWTFQYSLVSCGRGDAQGRRPSPVVNREEVLDGRIEWQRGDGLRESYVNNARGIEQVFVLDRRPDGDARDPVVIEGLIDGLLAYPADDGQSVLLRTPAGIDAARWKQLVVRDAASSALPACLDASGGMLRILIDDRVAIYPVTVDPLMTSPAWTVEGLQRSANLGFSVATAGDVNGDGYSDVIIGAPGYSNGGMREGRAFVYHGSASGLALTAAWITEGVGADEFGRCVATAGDVNGDGYSDVFVSEPRWHFNQPDEGRVNVYHGSPSGLSATPSWQTSGPGQAANGAFGFSVATAGDVNGDGFSDLIVGAHGYNVLAYEGKVFAYYGSATGLSGISWEAEGTQGFEGFGTSVATAGDANGDGYSDVIVGSPSFDGPDDSEGRAVVFHGSSSGLEMAPAFVAEGNVTGAFLGVSVATAGDVNGDGYSDVIAGASSFNGGQAGEGRAMLFLGSATGLVAPAAWTYESNQARAGLGICVATAGDVNGDGRADVIVGADRYDNGVTDEGAAFLFLGTATGLTPTPTWTAEGDQQGGDFARRVATAGDVNGDGYSDVIVGAQTFDYGFAEEGRAFVYHGSAAGLASASGWSAGGDQAGPWFGYSVSPAGDVNGDGFSDVVVGAPLYDGGESNEGAAFGYLGSASGLGLTPAWTAERDQALAEFGGSVGTAGDVNGDGYSDVIVGAHYYNGGLTWEGGAFVYQGSASGLSTTPAWTKYGEEEGAQFGRAVATAGDVNGDGYSDVIVGAHYYNNGVIDAGRAFAFLGSPSGLSMTPAWTAESDQGTSLFGASVATAGDVNGDGYSDVLVGAWRYDGATTSDEGRAFAYLGSASGLDSSPAWTAAGDQTNADFGGSVATAGDVNGDGYSDVLVGAHRFEGGPAFPRRAHLFLGSPVGIDATPAWTVEPPQAAMGFGTPVGTAGDVNGDGYSDVIVGAAGENGQVLEGQALVYLGSASGLGATPAWTAEGEQDAAQFGIGVATAGDVNGDGYSDVIIGAIGYDGANADEGRAFLYYGNDGDGLDRLPRQRWSDDSAPIDLLGIADAGTGFRIHARARSPYGRDRVRLEADVKPLGMPFSNGAILTTPYTDTGTPGVDGSFVDLSVLAAPLAGGPHQWRARLRGTFPFPWQSHWMKVPGNGARETDLRVAGIPLTCDAGPPQTAGCGAVMLDGSGSSGPPGTTYLWSSQAPEVVIDSPTIEITSASVSGSGTFLVSLTLTAGLDSVTCTTTLSTDDLLPPAIACPTLPVMATTQPGMALVAVIASASDNCDPVVAITNDRTAGGADATDTYPCGDTVVTFTATDSAGNVASCGTTVTVADPAPPLEVSAPASPPLRVNRDAAGIHVSFEDRGANELFNLYAGTIQPATTFAYDHAPVACKVAGAPVGAGVAELLAPLDPGASHYYLMSASNCAGESPRGFRWDGVEHPALGTDCGSLP